MGSSYLERRHTTRRKWVYKALLGEGYLLEALRPSNAEPVCERHNCKVDVEPARHTKRRVKHTCWPCVEEAATRLEEMFKRCEEATGIRIVANNRPRHDKRGEAA